jgi:hypothetical protein
MRLRVHRGTREIGGTCIDLENSGSRIFPIALKSARRPSPDEYSMAVAQKHSAR